MIYESVFHSSNYWVEFYGDVAEEYPPQIPEPLGKPSLCSYWKSYLVYCKPVQTSTFVDSDHASNFVTMRSYKGILLFVCNVLIKDLSKQHNTV